MKILFLGAGAFGLCLLGAGCTIGALPAAIHTAAPLQAFQSAATPPLEDGFGELPALPHGAGVGSVEITAQLPEPADAVTVLRTKSGTPNETETRPILDTLHIPEGAVGALPETSALVVDWADGTGYDWHYDAASRALTASVTSATPPLTVRELPPDDQVISAAKNFITTRGFTFDQADSAQISPDWNAWWMSEQSNGRCMDAATVNEVRALSDTTGPVPAALFHLPTAGCTDPEFPTIIHVVYPLQIDNRDVVNPDASPVLSYDLAYDASAGAVTKASILLPSNPDRSDYPGATADQIRARFAQNAPSGTTDITSVTAVLEQITNPADGRIYLIPALLGEGTRTAPDGTSSGASIVVPLTR